MSGFTGGGTAGGGIPSKAGPQYIRNIPKFLQKYEHLMEKREGQPVTRASAEAPGAEDVEEDDDFEADIRGATIVYDERNGSDPYSTGGEGAGEGEEDEEDESRWMTAEQMKERGNAAYGQGDWSDAILWFTRAIRKDPGNAVLFSNRSAAFSGLKDFESSLKDAEKALALHPKWPKAFSRAGAALLGLKRYEEAASMYTRGLKHDPRSQVLSDGAKQAQERQQRQEEKDARDGKHLFKKRKAGEDQGRKDPQRRKEQQNPKGRNTNAPGKGKPLLSFSEEQEEDE